jgi:uncharacterized delta-60 repeat protein
VVAGFAYINPTYDFCLARLNPDGSLDTSFDDDGFVTSDLGLDDRITDSLVQPDGKIVAGGYSNFVSPPNYGSYFALARYTPEGSLDTGFGEGGMVITAINGYDKITAIERQPDGKIVAAGETEWLEYKSPNLGPSPNAKAFALARYTLDGGLDTSFGEEGLVTTDIVPGTDEYAYDMLLQPDGRIVVAGKADFFIVLVRYR